MDSDGMLAGCIPMLPTPFDDEGAVDFRGFTELVEWAADTFAYFAFGGLGSECLTLSIDERVQLARIATVRSHAQAVIGCGAQSAEETLRIIDHALDLGVRALMVSAPNDATDVLSFFRGVAGSVGSTQIVIQNAARWIGLSTSASDIHLLHAEFPEVVVYAKPEGSPSAEAIAELTAPNNMAVLAGLGGTGYRDALMLGAIGVVPFPEGAVALRDFHLTYEQDGAGERFERILPLLAFEFETLEHAILCSKIMLRSFGIPIGERLRVVAPRFTEISRALLRVHVARAGL